MVVVIYQKKGARMITEQIIGLEFELSDKLAKSMVRMGEDYKQFAYKYPKETAP